MHKPMYAPALCGMHLDSHLEVTDVPGIDRTIFLLLEMISFHVVLTSFPVTKSTFNLWGDKIMGQQHREKGTTDNILLS